MLQKIDGKADGRFRFSGPLFVDPCFWSLSLVQDIIRTLSVFVPCHVQKLAKIKAWSDAKLTDKELADVRLVGASKDNVDSSIFKLDMACMDVTVERKASLITSPLYLDGRWIHEIIKYMDSAPVSDHV